MHVARFDLLIDGYNLMHVAGFGRAQYGPKGFQQQRERFLEWLWKRLPPNLRERTIVVFDAGESDTVYVNQASHHDLRLLYSPRGLEADDLIEELIELHSAPRQLQVVSSDHRLHKAARRRRATCLDSEAFIIVMARIAREARARRAAAEELAKPSGELPEETREWLRVFAEADALLANEPVSLAAPPADSVPPPTPPTKRSATTDATLPPTPQRESDRATPAGTDPPSLPADELAFWEERLRDLLSGR